MEKIIHRCKKSFSIFYHPVCKRGTADLCTKSAKLLFKPVKRHAVTVLLVNGPGNGGSRCHTVHHMRFPILALNNVWQRCILTAVFASVVHAVVFDHSGTCRDDLQLTAYEFGSYFFHHGTTFTADTFISRWFQIHLFYRDAFQTFFIRGTFLLCFGSRISLLRLFSGCKYITFFGRWIHL